MTANCVLIISKTCNASINTCLEENYNSRLQYNFEKSKFLFRNCQMSALMEHIYLKSSTSVLTLTMGYLKMFNHQAKHFL